MLPDAAVAHYQRQQNTTAAVLVAARKQWAALGRDDFDTAWRTVGPRLLLLVAAGQKSAARDGARYIPLVLDELNLDAPAEGSVAVGAFVGVASDGRPLDSLLYEPVIRAKQSIGAGATAEAGLAAGLLSLERIVQTQLADAARGAAQVAMVSRPRVTGYVRMLSLPSCSRCAVLAGRLYRVNAGFPRHPRCDCRHIPANESIAGDLTTDPRKAIEAGQVIGLSKAERRAIVEDGADVGQVVNSRRGMTTTLGRKTTTEGTTARGSFGRAVKNEGAVKDGSRYRRATTVRLRPEAIYAEAKDRDDAIRLLKRFGYLN